jgi:hypothetical protein
MSISAAGLGAGDLVIIGADAAQRFGSRRQG